MVVNAFTQAQPSRGFIFTRYELAQAPPQKYPVYNSTVKSRLAGDGLGKLSYRVEMGAWDILGQERCMSVDDSICLLESVVVQIRFEPISFSLVAWES